MNLLKKSQGVNFLCRKNFGFGTRSLLGVTKIRAQRCYSTAWECFRHRKTERTASPTASTKNPMLPAFLCLSYEIEKDRQLLAKFRYRFRKIDNTR